MNKLAIYACSGIGYTTATSPVDLVQFETEDTNTLRNTRAMNALLVRMNENRAIVLYDNDITQEERQNFLDELDIYSVAFYFARLYHGKKDMLEISGRAIQSVISAGRFKSEEPDIEKHADIVDTLIDVVQDLIDNEDSIELETAGSFIDYWAKVVMPNDIAFLETEQAKAIGDLQAYGIEKDSDLSKYLTQASEYFLYFICLTRDEAYYVSNACGKKWDKQSEIYDYCKKCFVGIYGDEESMLRIIRTGLYQSFKMSVGRIHDQLLYGDEAIGITAEIATIIVALIGVISSVILAVLSYAEKVTVAKYTQPENVQDGIADVSDFDGMGTGKGKNDEKNDSNLLEDNALLIGAGVLALLFFV